MDKQQVENTSLEKSLYSSDPLLGPDIQAQRPSSPIPSTSSRPPPVDSIVDDQAPGPSHSRSQVIQKTQKNKKVQAEPYDEKGTQAPEGVGEMGTQMPLMSESGSGSEEVAEPEPVDEEMFDALIMSSMSAEFLYPDFDHKNWPATDDIAHREPGYTCKVCLVKTLKKLDFTSHFFNEHRCEPKPVPIPGDFLCGLCKGPFNDPVSFGLHKRLHIIKYGEDGKRYLVKCIKCTTSFRRWSQLIIHYENHRESSLHKCEHCSETFEYDFYLDDHMKEMHGKKKRKAKTRI